MTIKVSIADDHPIVLNGIRKILEDFHNIEVLGVFKGGKALLSGLRKQQPDVLLLDINMPDVQGDELARMITKSYPAVKILVLTNMDQAFFVHHLFKNGASGYLLKNAESETLSEAIKSVYLGIRYIDPALKQKMSQDAFDAQGAPTVPTLTRREQEILELIAEEYTSHEIAKKLFIALSTVENHRLNLFLKLGVKNAAGLVRKSVQLGLIK